MPKTLEEIMNNLPQERQDRIEKRAVQLQIEYQKYIHQQQKKQEQLVKTPSSQEDVTIIY